MNSRPEQPCGPHRNPSIPLDTYLKAGIPLGPVDLQVSLLNDIFEFLFLSLFRPCALLQLLNHAILTRDIFGIQSTNRDFFDICPFVLNVCIKIRIGTIVVQ